MFTVCGLSNSNSCCLTLEKLRTPQGSICEAGCLCSPSLMLESWRILDSCCLQSMLESWKGWVEYLPKPQSRWSCQQEWEQAAWWWLADRFNTALHLGGRGRWSFVNSRPVWSRTVKAPQRKACQKKNQKTKNLRESKNFLLLCPFLLPPFMVALPASNNANKKLSHGSASWLGV